MTSCHLIGPHNYFWSQGSMSVIQNVGMCSIHSVNVCWAKKRKEGKEKVGEEKRLLEFG